MTDPQTDTSLWHLWLRVGRSGLMALMAGPESVERSVRFSSVDFKAAETPLRALEDAVYSTPMLPADFASVTVMIDSDAFALMPAEAATDAEAIVRALHPDRPESDELLEFGRFGLHGDIAMGLLHPADSLNFLRRTFANPVFAHPLQAVATYLGHVNSRAGDPRRAWAILAAGTLLMVCFDAAGEISFANRFEAADINDAAYYVLAALPADCPLMVGGPSELRNALADMLRPYVDPVMPITLSANLLHLLGQAPNAPLDLLMLTQI